MSVSELDVIDFVAQRPDTNEMYFIISDHLAWDAEGHINALKSKVNAYVDYIQSDALLEAYPNANEKNHVIEVLYTTEPNSYALDAFSHFTKMGDDMNFRFSHRIDR
jgi:hypothetical protein